MELKYRHGDVALLKVNGMKELREMQEQHKIWLNNGESKTINQPVVLATGEATGHIHLLEAPILSKLGTDVYHMPKGGELTSHPEHANITLEPGYYIVKRQLEYFRGQYGTYVRD